MIPEMMLCVHIKSDYDSIKDSKCTHCIMLNDCKMIL